MDFWDLDVHTIKLKKAFCCYLLARRKWYLDTTVICTAAWKKGIDMYSTSTPEPIKIIQQLWEDVKQHYQDDKIRRDKDLLSKANLESDAGDEEKANIIRHIKKAERRNQCYQKFRFHQGTEISAQEINRIQLPMSWNAMEEYKEDDEFKWIDPKKVDKDNKSLWWTITVPAETAFFSFVTQSSPLWPIQTWLNSIYYRIYDTEIQLRYIN